MKNKVQLITYADRLGDGTIKSMTDILRTRFDGVYDGVHILPFFTPFDGADAGFDPIDHTKVDERLGSPHDPQNDRCRVHCAGKIDISIKHGRIRDSERRYRTKHQDRKCSADLLGKWKELIKQDRQDR